VSSIHPYPIIETPEAGVLRRLVEEAQQWERSGQQVAARKRYEKALDLLGDSDPRLAADLTRWVGRTYVPEGNLDAARDCADRSLAIAREAGSLVGVAHALNFLGTLSQKRGSLAEAEELYGEAARTAVEADDQGVLAMVRLNQGIIANIRGELDRALDHYHSSLAGLKEVRQFDLVISALNNLGMVLTDLERWDEAKAAYAEALEFCGTTGNRGVEVVVEVNRAEMLVAQGSFLEAEAACQSAFRLMRSLGDLRAAGDMLKLQGIIARELEEYEKAESHFERADHHAGERGDLLLAAEVAREQATLFWRQKRSRETLVALNRAHRIFSTLRARRDLADIDEKMEELEATFIEIVRLWGESIESADRYTHGHCVRVARYACALSRKAGMDEQTLFWLNLGALLHDVGKIIIPPEILNKPGGFTPQERLLMEKHPDAGVELLDEIEFPWDIRPMVRFHHERWMGGGYPTGISGEEIPESARVLAIADVFDALATDRPYRRAFSTARCLEIMKNEMPGFFDPTLLALWEGMVEKGEVMIETPAAGGRVGASEPDVVSTSDLRVLCVPMTGWWSVPADANGMSFTSIAPDRLDAVLATESFEALILEETDPDDEWLARLRQLRAEFPQPAIVVVGSGEPESLALRAIQAGAHEYLVHDQVSGPRLERAVRQAIERHRVQQEISSRSMFDELTGAYNRRGFFSVARQHLKLAERTGRELFLLFADVDFMKRINDRFGHAAGDRALRDFSNLLQECFRKSDLVARMGGDEFVVLMLETSAAAVPLVIERLHERLREIAPSGEKSYDFTVSIGVARYDPAAPQPLEAVLEEADRAMYAEKRRLDHLDASSDTAPEGSVVIV
jgi:diguanylate cyclase (GGDEF)-like protein/putative nucleotidyltransferase with HDIG domain